MFRHTRRGPARLASIFLVAWLAALVGCGEQPLEPLPLQSIAPDFGLVDVNPGSATYGQVVTPRGQLDKVSAWYFASAT
jgi:hypothetical protein